MDYLTRLFYLIGQRGKYLSFGIQSKIESDKSFSWEVRNQGDRPPCFLEIPPHISLTTLNKVKLFKTFKEHLNDPI